MFNELAESTGKLPRLLTHDQVDLLTCTTRKFRLRLEARGDFPHRIPLSARTTAYLASEVKEWIEEKAADRTAALRSRKTPNPLAKSNRRAK